FHAECDYKKPLHFEDLVEIHLLVSEKRSKSLNLTFRFRKMNNSPPVEVARGALTIVCVTHHPDGTMSAAAIPKEIANKIEVAPAELLQYSIPNGCCWSGSPIGAGCQQSII